MIEFEIMKWIMIIIIFELMNKKLELMNKELKLKRI